MINVVPPADYFPSPIPIRNRHEPHLNCREGDVVFIRATVLEACSDQFQVVIDDRLGLSVTAWLPAAEIAKAEDMGHLKPMRRRVDLKYLELEKL
jgi:hypothetical protein